MSAYIPTNVISITDGQIFLEPKLFYSGVRPAINVGISVSRVGGDAQITPMKKVAGRLKLELSQYRDLEAFAQFGSDLDPETQRTLARGERLVKTLNQGERRRCRSRSQVAMIYAATSGYVDRIDADRVEEFHRELVERVHSTPRRRWSKIARRRLVRRDPVKLEKTIKQFAEDFGYDLDEEGQPLSDDAEDAATSRSRSKPTTTSDDDSTDDGRVGRRGEGGGRGLARAAATHGPEGRQATDRLRQERPEDHARDGDGRRRAPAPGGAAHRRPAPVRRGDPPDDPAGRRGRRQRPEPPDLEDREDPKTVAHRDHDGRPRPGRRVQLADHPRRDPRGGRARGAGPQGRLLRVRPPRRLVAARSAAARPRASTPGTPTARPTPTRARSPTTSSPPTCDDEVDRVEVFYNALRVADDAGRHREVLLPMQQATVAEAAGPGRDLEGRRRGRPATPR